MTSSSENDDPESLPFVPSSEAEIANAFVLHGMLLKEIQKDQEENPEEWE